MIGQHSHMVNKCFPTAAAVVSCRCCRRCFQIQTAFCPRVTWRPKMRTFTILLHMDPYWAGQLRHVPVSVTLSRAAILEYVPACTYARVCVLCLPYLRSALLKLFSSGSTRVISITCGTFYLTLNYKPDLAPSKLQHRPFAHNYVLWIMAMCLKYKHSDGIDCSGFMSWRSWQNERNISGNGWAMQKGSECRWAGERKK